MPLNHDNLVNRYLQAVGFWLPRGQKKDILAELREDLRSLIDDREETLGCRLDEDEIAAILKQRGRPIYVAGSFLPQQSLIGPVLYPIYLFVLKIVALCYLVPWLLIWIGIAIFDRTQMRIHLAGELQGLGTLWTIAFTQFGIITLIFAAIDRVSAKSQLLRDWDPRKLPKVRLSETTKRRGQALAGVVFGILGFAWLLVVPAYPFLLLGPAIYALKPAPVWSAVYPFLLILSAAGIAENAVTLLRPHLDRFRHAFKLGTTSLSLWVAYRLWPAHIYLVPVDADKAPYAAIVNFAIQIGIGCAAAGLTIGLCFHAWKTFQAIARASAPAATRMA